MRKTFFQRLTFLLLAVVMVVGVLPLTFAQAADMDGTPPTSETIPPGTEPTVSTTPLPDSPMTVSGEEFYIAPSDSAIMPLATGDTFSGQADYPGYVVSAAGKYYDELDENGDPYPIDNITLWRFNRSGKTYFMYCLQPNVDTMGGYQGEEGVLDGSAVWANLTRDQQQLVGLTLIYGCPNGLDPSTTSDASGHGYWMQAATQMVVWEIVLGWRDPNTGELTDTRLRDAFCNDARFSYDGVTVAWKDTHGYIADYYNQVEEKLIRHVKYPSFTVPLDYLAPTIDLYPDGSGKFTATVTDTNGVLEDYTFTDGNGLTFQTSGNDLTITADSTFSGSAVVAPTKVVPSLEKQSFILWTGKGGNAGGQVQVSTAGKVQEDPLPAYFKVRLAVGTLKIVKETNTGNDRSGWPFGVYTDSACTQAVEGSPFTSGEDGTIAANLAPGTYYVKELGSRPGWQMDTEVKEVTVVAGETATVTFRNVQLGTVKIVKETNTGNDRSGWPFGVYKTYANGVCSDPVEGLPFTSGEDGTITANLAPGTYYVKELGSRPGWQMDTEVKEVTVVAGETATVTFRNVQLGNVRIVKTSDDGLVAGRMFNIFDISENGELGNLVDDQFYTDENGVALIPDLLPGWYEISELLPENSPYIQPQKQIVEVKAGETTEVKFHNVLRPGEITARKVDPMGDPLAGAKFLLEWQDGTQWKPVTFSEAVMLGGCSSEGLENGCLVSGEDGTVTFTGLYLLSTYRIVEVEAPDGYIKQEGSIFEGNLPTDTRSVTVTAVNHPATGGIKIIKTSDDGVVAGLMFNIFDVDENGEIIGSVDDQFYTDENGVALIPELLPGWYEISELLPDDSPYIQPQKQIVEVKAGEITEVKFHNVLRPGEITVRKADPTGKPLSGAKFLLEWSLGGKTWRPVIFSEKVIFGGCTSEGLEDGCLVSGEDGLISFTGLYSTLQYRLTEVKAPNGYILHPDPIFVGQLPAEELTLTLTVHNSPGYALPQTGDIGFLTVTVGTMVLLCTISVFFGNKAMKNKKFFTTERK